MRQMRFGSFGSGFSFAVGFPDMLPLASSNGYDVTVSCGGHNAQGWLVGKQSSQPYLLRNTHAKHEMTGCVRIHVGSGGVESKK